MKINEWVDHPEDGQSYRLFKIRMTPSASPWRFCLECCEDVGDNHSFVEVSDSAFADWEHMSAFAAEIGDLLQCSPATIIRAMS